MSFLKYFSFISGPSQLLNETALKSERATPQAPVYATIRPAHSPNRPISSPLRNSFTSLPSALASTDLVKTAAPVTIEEPIRFHPTNPFYSTLPSNNYSSASKLPIPNGKSTYSNLDRSKPINRTNDSTAINNCNSTDVFKNEYYNTNLDYSNSQTESLFNRHEVQRNGYSDSNTKEQDDIRNTFGLSVQNTIKENESNPLFKEGSNLSNNYSDYSKNIHSNYNDKSEIRENDPFKIYSSKEANENHKESTRNFSNSQSEGNLHSNNEEITRHSVITEHKVNKIEEVKTIKMVILNGSNDHVEKPFENLEHSFGSPNLGKYLLRPYNVDVSVCLIIN